MKSYTAVLTEIWDDFIGKPREEANKDVMSKVSKQPSKPVKPTAEKTLMSPQQKDFDCAGQKCMVTSTGTSGSRAFGSAMIESSDTPVFVPDSDIKYFSEITPGGKGLD